MKTYTAEELAAQPIGYWSGETYRQVVGKIRSELGQEGLTQPHWWILNHIAGAPASWSRTELTRRLAKYDDLEIDFDAVFNDLSARGWTLESDGVLTLTQDGDAGLVRARRRMAAAHELTHRGIAAADYVAALDVLRRMIENLGGDSDLP